jgi:hypothetical protein
MGKPVQHKEKKVESRLLDIHFLHYSLNKPLPSGISMANVRNNSQFSIKPKIQQTRLRKHSTAAADKSKATKLNFAFFQDFQSFYRRT